MKHNDLDEVGRKSHYELEDELETLQENLGTLQAIPIPEITLSFSASATLPVDAKFFYLPRDHFYEAGRSPIHITQILVDGVDKTAGEGTVWDECPRNVAGSFFPGQHLQSVAGTYDDGTIANLTWGIERLVTTASEEWLVQWIEKRIIFNPLQARGCLMSGDTTFDTSSAWYDRDSYMSTLINAQNTNGFIVSGCPDDYQIMVMTCQAPRFTGDGHAGARGKHWRPSFRCDPRSGTDWEAFYIGRFKTNRLIGIALHNPLTGARSDVRLVGYNGWSSTLGEHEIRVLK